MLCVFALQKQVQVAAPTPKEKSRLLRTCFSLLVPVMGLESERNFIQYTQIPNGRETGYYDYACERAKFLHEAPCHRRQF